MKRMIGLFFLLILSLYTTVTKAQSAIDGNWDFHIGEQSSGTLRLKDSAYQAYYFLTVHEDTPVRIIIKGDLPECFYDLVGIWLYDEDERRVDIEWEVKTIDEIGRIFEISNLKAGKYFLEISGYELDNIHAVTPGMPDFYDFEYTIDCRGLQYDLGTLHTGIYSDECMAANMTVLSFGKIEGQKLKVALTTQPNARINVEVEKYECNKEVIAVNGYKEIEYVDSTHQIIRISPELSGDIALTIMSDDRDSTTVCCPFSYTIECMSDISFNKGFSTLGHAPYIKKRTFQDSSGKIYLDEIQYFNGLGFPVQKVQKEITPFGDNLITMQEYDGMGRITKEWLPVCAHSSYLFQEDKETFRLNACQQYGDIFPFTLSCYETSSREKLVKLYQPGYGWNAHPYDRFLGHESNSNNITITRFHINTVSGKLERNGIYAKGVLRMETTVDEDLKKKYEFKDSQGRTLLTRQANVGENIDTYYIYDDFGNLCYVLPPAISDIVDLDENSDQMKRYAYIYRYDYRNRCIAKRLPGCGWTYYAYDKADRLVYSQDSIQRRRKECTFCLNDNSGREVVTGICTVDDSLSAFLPDISQYEVKAIYKGGDHDGDMGTGYIFQHLYGVSKLQILSVNYYDSYNFPQSYILLNELDYDVNEYGKRYGDASDSLRYCHKGLLTGNVTAILGTDKCLYKTLYYDKYQRCIQIQSINHLGERESDAYSYSYTGQVLMRHHTISSPGAASMEEYYEYNYDHAGRLTDVQYDPVQIGTDSTVDIESAHLVDIRYDKLGRLETVIHHDGWGDVISYDYNIRDWTTHLDGKHFEQTLQYESSSHRVTPCFNGNISCMIWNTDSLTRGYKYFYDGHNRLMNALYAEGDSLKQNVGRFDEEITGYDKLGNILGLKRFGQTTETEYGLIDNLTLTYDGNQLSSVVDSVVTPSYIGNFEFRDGANLPVEYLYDLNGNLIQDLNKNIVDIQYNCLNLPSRIQFGDGNFISYLYSSIGTKLRSSHCIGGDTLTTDYCGNAIYENGVLTKLLNDYGYLSLSGDATYHYFIRDYQGNVRAVVTSEGEAEEINHYYPFGGTFASSVGSVQPYKYNGKELDRKGGLDWYDYGARHYDAALGRWHAVDPMAEKYYDWSPYNYCANNPIKYIDPDGKDWYKVQNEEGIWTYSYSADIHSQKDLNKVVRNGMYLGVTHTENNIYYSLFGSKKVANSFEGVVYQKIDNAILTSAIAEKNVNNYFGGEDTGNSTTDFSIEGINLKESRYLGLDTHRNEYNIEYEGSSSGLYNVLGGKGAMKGYMENWVGDRDMPKDIGGWQNGQKAYHIRFMNKKGVDILHLKYSKSAANTLVDKYNRLFFNREK